MVIETLAALWLFPAGVIALLLLQFWQARRRELLAGSLIVWRRVAEKERAKPRRRLVLDRSFWLQTATLLALAWAWANPALMGRSAPGRQFVVVVDNGPSARLRTAGGGLAWDGVRAAVQEFLSGLQPNDRVVLCTSVPCARHTTSRGGDAPGRALDALGAITPGLSFSATGELWHLALDEARVWPGAEGSGDVRSVVFSTRAAPPDESGYELARWIAVPPAKPVSNVGLTAWGATSPFDPDVRELLVQVRNFGATGANGTVSCEVRDGPAMEPRKVDLSAGGTAGVVFAFQGPFRPCRVTWRAEAGPDALTEDDELTVVPGTSGTFRTRWHGSAPHLQDLYRVALRAEEVAIDAKESVDLEIYVECLPGERAPAGRAFLLLAPPGEYGPFEVLAGTVKRPVAYVGAPDALTRGLYEGPTGLDWPIAEARVIRQVGDLRVLAQDGEGRVLAARFTQPDGAPAYVFAFVPGEGLGWAPERRFDSPGLAAVLLRVLREAAGADRPFVVQQAEAIERATGTPLPLDWRPGFDGEKGTGQGVLDARVSGASLAEQATVSGGIASLAGRRLPERYALWPYLVVLAIALILAEVRAGRTRIAVSVSSGRLNEPVRSLASAGSDRSG